MEIEFWKDKIVLITGSKGFVGKHLVKKLENCCDRLYTPTSGYFDLRNPHRVNNMFQFFNSKIDVVFNLAANVGGIGYNQNHPYSLYYDNTMINANMIEGARGAGVKKFIQLGTVCAYPKFTTVPFDERALWDGYPEETNAPYGLAKRNSLVQLQAARQEFGFNGIYILPTNLYGPEDHFEPERSHVIAALITKFIEAVEKNKDIVEIWGSGDASRDFLYVEDAIEGIILAAEKYDSSEPINLGTGEEIRICILANIIANECGYNGKIVYNTNRPDGQPRRCLRIWKAKELGWKPKTTLKEGLKKTIAWYKENR